MAGADPDKRADPKTIAESLACWRGKVTAEPLGGGLTNANFAVADAGRRFVVRVGNDIPQHQVMRFNERAAALAAHAAGLSPEVVHHEDGALVTAFVAGRTLTPQDLREPQMLPRVASLVRACHSKMSAHLRGPLLMFWPFHVVRDYAATLRAGHSRWLTKLDGLLDAAKALERAVTPVDIAFCHNDLLAANLIDDGERLWLLDWDYAGFNAPLFDLANLASNNGLDGEAEQELLRLYFGRAPSPDLLRRHRAMRTVSLLREAMWGMVSELHSRLPIDYVAYAREHLDKFEAELAGLERETM